MATRICPICKKEINSLGYARHRAAHVEAARNANKPKDFEKLAKKKAQLKANKKEPEFTCPCCGDFMIETEKLPKVYAGGSSKSRVRRFACCCCDYVETIFKSGERDTEYEPEAARIAAGNLTAEEEKEARRELEIEQGLSGEILEQLYPNFEEDFQ